tara:strand:- start:157 stop:969 length:813 start_codon:yes stop_codon:yes gene_type:complete
MEKNSELIDLFYGSKKKSIKWQKYFKVYEKLFSKYRNKKITFVEIGILDGGSLEIWKKYFGNSARIIGIDKNPECKKLANENFEVFIGSQTDHNFWSNFFNQVGNVDIVLDDGGHTNNQQLISLIESIKYINDGGIHVVEDIHSNYQKHYGNPHKYSFVNFSKKTIDDINTKFPNIKKFEYSLNDYVHSIEFFESIIAFKINKDLCYENILLDNNGLSNNNKDLTLDEKILNFRNKFKFFYKFKFFTKIERVFINLMYKKRSKQLKDFFR